MTARDLLTRRKHQLTLAPTRPLPAPHQHGDFLVAAYKRREMALTGAAAAAAGANKSEQRHWFRHPFESRGATLLDHEQPGDLTLHARRNHDRAWLC